MMLKSVKGDCLNICWKQRKKRERKKKKKGKKSRKQQEAQKVGFALQLQVLGFLHQHIRKKDLLTTSNHATVYLPTHIGLGHDFLLHNV